MHPLCWFVLFVWFRPSYFIFVCLVCSVTFFCFCFCFAFEASAIIYCFCSFLAVFISRLFLFVCLHLLFLFFNLFSAFSPDFLFFKRPLQISVHLRLSLFFSFGEARRFAPLRKQTLWRCVCCS